MAEYLSLDQLGLDSGPGLALGSVGKQIHDDSAFSDSLINIEQVLAGDPAILFSLLPRSTVLPDTDDDVEAVVAEVEALAMALGAVTDQGEGVVLEVFLRSNVRIAILDHVSSGSSHPVTHEKFLPRPVSTLW